MAEVFNNLCPICSKGSLLGRTVEIKIDPSSTITEDTILCCVHTGLCSILDIVVDSNTKLRGFLTDQNGICGERSEFLKTINLGGI